MRYLTILGEKKKIPPYPHHKDYIYRCRQFFDVDSFITLVIINGVVKALKQSWRRWKYNYAIPLNLLLDPTSACNLKCKGCWAADYDKSAELSYEKLDEILTDAEKLGISDIVMSGGEPLMRRNDILKLCKKHHRLPFALFTNGTLIDEAFADEIVKLGNLNVYISIDGFREQTDFRRGQGTFDKVVAAMDILRKRDIGFGFSACYHANNYQEICSDEFLDFLRAKGAWIGWMFNYMPIGSNSDVTLCCKADQRSYVKQKIEAYTRKNRFIIIDFANLGHKAFGCVGAGIGFVHINAHGDLEPCAFNHYSDMNIRDKSLREALASPFFKKFREAMPFSKNVYRPCPIMDVPEAIVRLSQIEGVHSTHLNYPETAEQLALKTRTVADEWEPIADKLFRTVSKKEKRKIRLLTKFLLSKS